MRHNSILSILAKGLMAAAVAVSIPAGTWAQGITVKTKDGKSVDYPAEKFSHISPYIFEVSSTTYTQGAVATLQYEKAADLNVARTSHQVFATSAGLVVIGGHTTYYVPTETAELWQNGQWRPVATNGYPYDTGFSVTLSDGRVMVGGGYSEIGGLGGSAKTCIFNPATQTFVGGPEMTSARSNCKAIATSRGVYVSGNFGSSSTDSFFDFYNGSTFAKVGNPDPHYRPYLFTDAKGNVYTLSTMDNKGNTIALKQSSSGVTCLYGDKYDAAANKDYYYFYSAYATYMPLTLSADIRTEEYRRTDRNGFLVLAKNAAGNYLLTEPCPDEGTTYNHNKFVIPSQHPVTNALITWRGGVYVNNAKNEAYLIGSSGQEGNYTIHVISYNYKDYYWTIASASGFSYNLATASWTLMADGRLACTGGNTKSDARKDFYIITPPKAGMESSSGTKSYGIDIFKTDGTNDRYMESQLESVTTYEPKGEDDNQIFSKGGTVTFDDLTLTFPQGTYSEGWGSTVEVKKMQKGSVISGDELSDCYYLSFFADTYKPITVQLPAEKGNDVMLAVKSRGFIPSSGDLTEVDMISMLPTTYADGVYTAQIPAFEIGKDFDGDIGDREDIDSDAQLVIALVETADAQSSSRTVPLRETRAVRRANYTLRWTPSSSKDYEQDRMIRDEIMPDVLDKLQLLGFELPKGDAIPIYMEEFTGKDSLTWGVYKMDKYSDAFDCVMINKRLFKGRLSNEDKIELRCTLLHECQHYLQGHGYNPNWTNYGTNFGYAWGNSQWQILDECSAVWCEKFYTNTPGLGIKYGADAVRNFFPDEIWCSWHMFDTTDGLGQAVPSGNAFDRCGNHGYGLSIFVRYLAERYGDTAPAKLFYARKNGKKTVRACFEQMGKDVGNNNILSYDVLIDFMEKACMGTLFDADKINFDYFVTEQNNNVLSRDGNKTVERQMPAIGAEVHRYYLPVSYEGSLDKTLTITQKSSDIRTVVYLVENNRWADAKLLGSTTAGEPVKFSDLARIKGTGKGSSSTCIYTISIPMYDKPATLDLSFQIEEDVQFIVSPEQLQTFEAEGGTQTITVTTNQPKITGGIADKTWLSAKLNGNVITVTAQPNTSTTERQTLFTLRVRDAKDNIMDEKTITVRQKGKSVHYQGAFVDGWQSIDGKNHLILNSDGSFYKKFGNADAVTGTYQLVNYQETDGGRAWSCTIIDPEGNTVSFNKESGWWFIVYEGVELFPSDYFM